ncbi:MAG: substrate-binding domain-containing protein [Lachnotalea sp.]
MRRYIRNKYTIWILSIMMLISLGCLVGIQIRYMNLMRSQTTDLTNLEGIEYKYHCAFITDSYDDPFWNSIYEGAKEEGVLQNVYIENYGQKLSLHYTIDEKMEMAIAASVDAIIIEGNDEVSTTNVIDKAIDQGITVVTIYQDQVQSKRRSFIGVNKFRMGYNLCAKAYESLENDDDEIMVLYDQKNEVNPENTILNSGIKKFLNDRSSNA